MEWILSRSDSPQIKEAGRASEEDSGKNREEEAVLGECERSAPAAPPSRNLPKARRAEAQLRGNRSPRAQRFLTAVETCLRCRQPSKAGARPQLPVPGRARTHPRSPCAGPALIPEARPGPEAASSETPHPPNPRSPGNQPPTAHTLHKWAWSPIFCSVGGSLPLLWRQMGGGGDFQ